MGMIERFTGIFVSPSELFNKIKAEKEYNPTLMYFLVFIVGSSIVSFAISLLAGIQLNIKNSIVGWFVSVIGVLLFAFFLGLVASWFGGTRSWVQGLKVAVYPGTIFAVLGIIMAIIGVLFKGVTNIDLSNSQAIYAAILANLGAVVGFGIVFVLIILAALVWTIVLYIKAAMISHNLSGGKAFLTLLIAAIFYSIAMSIVSWILSAVGLITTLAPFVD